MVRNWLNGPTIVPVLMQGVDAGLGVVAEVGADLHQAAVDRPAADAERDRAVVGAQVADLRAGAEVDPLADVGVAQEAVVGLVGVAVQDAGLDLAADAAVRADAAAAQFRTQNVAVAGRRSTALPAG